jgi:hypothetical protein
LVRLGKLRRLLVNVPPRSLKSIAYSVALPAFIFGHDPSKRIIVVSYGADLSIKHAIDFRAIMNSSWYRRVFTETRISAAKNTESEVMTTTGGYRLGTSIDGTLTGRGGDLIVIDDPLKPHDAFSESRREKVNQWYFNTLLSRLDNKQTGAVIVVMQRLHMDDLSGALLGDCEEWTHLKLPAIAEVDEQVPIGYSRFYHRRAGDVLHPEREPMSVLESIRAQLGSDTFAAQYQQAPIPPGGAMIKRAWVRRYEQLSNRTSFSEAGIGPSVEEILRSWSRDPSSFAAADDKVEAYLGELERRADERGATSDAELLKAFRQIWDTLASELR